jgi:hypothetical protein
MAEKTFQGPGHWRRQAEQARGMGEDNPFAMLAEYARLLSDAGEEQAVSLVQRAARQAKAGDPHDAADLIEQAAGQLGHENAHLSAGLASVALLLSRTPDEDQQAPDEDPGAQPHLEG